MKKAIWYKTGDVDEAVEVQPKNGKDFSLEELQGFVRGVGENGVEEDLITIVPMPGGRILVANDLGKVIGLPYNEGASKVWREAYPIELYPFNNDGTIVGNALICDEKLVK